MLTASTLALAMGAGSVLNHSVHIPFSFDTLPRYTFCGNVSLR